MTYEDREVVAVVRPPLGANEYYGLVIGLVDELGRVDFTFTEEQANDIAAWLSNEVQGRRTRKREGTGFDHPLIKDVEICSLEGD